MKYVGGRGHNVSHLLPNVSEKNETEREDKAEGMEVFVQLRGVIMSTLKALKSFEKPCGTFCFACFSSIAFGLTLRHTVL